MTLGRGAHVVDAGPGRDRLTFGLGPRGPGSRAVSGSLDLARDRLVVRPAQGRRWSATVRSVGRVRLPRTGSWAVRGTGADEEIIGWGALTAYGRGGDDRLTGGREDDRLVGGPGDDRVRGRAGVDTCRGEDVRDCERVAR